MDQAAGQHREFASLRDDKCAQVKRGRTLHRRIERGGLDDFLRDVTKRILADFRRESALVEQDRRRSE